MIKLIIPAIILILLIVYISVEYGMDSADIHMDAQIDILRVR